MGVRKCTAAGKLAFVRHQYAEKLVAFYRRVAETGAVEVPRSVYRCVACRRWHVTGYTPEQTADWKRAQGKPPRATIPNRSKE